MREILFRAKRDPRYEYGTDWVYGVPYIDYENDCIMATCNSKLVVIADTVGQFTGLTDKNGRRIFEGDILAYGDDLFTVKWCEERIMFFLPCITNPKLEADFICSFCGKDFEIVGNIHDNPELIGGV